MFSINRCRFVFAVLLVSFVFTGSVVYAEQLVISLSLAQDLALRNASSIIISSGYQNIAEQQLRLSLRSWFPSLTVSYNDTNTVSFDKTDPKNHTLSLALKQPVFDGGRFRTQRELSASQLQLKQSRLDLSAIELRDSVWNIFYTILILKQKLAIQKDNYALALEQEKITSKQLELGEIREIDLIETQLELLSMEQSLRETEYQLDDTLLEFNALLGIDTSIELVLDGSLDEAYTGSVIKFTVDQLYFLALKQNADLDNLGYQIQAKQIELEALEKTWIPGINATFKYSLSGDVFPLYEHNFSASLDISFPDPLFPTQGSLSLTLGDSSRSVSTAGSAGILQDITTDSVTNEKNLSLTELVLKKEELQEQLHTEIERSLRNYENLRYRLSLQRRSFELQREKAAVTELQFEQGQITSLDLLNERNSMVSSEISILEQVLTLLQTERDLEKSVGLPAGGLF